MSECLNQVIAEIVSHKQLSYLCKKHEADAFLHLCITVNVHLNTVLKCQHVVILQICVLFLHDRMGKYLKEQFRYLGYKNLNLIVF